VVFLSGSESMEVLLLFVYFCMVVGDPIIRRGNRIGGVMFSVLVSSVEDQGFEPCSGQTKDYKIGICCFFTKYTALRKNSKDCLAQIKDNVFECPRLT
jgi:hypothetical protein